MIHDALGKHYSFSGFRPGQREVIESICAGQDTLAIMPTGGGKSLCFQLPALVSDKLTVVISPLIALMKDQVDALKARNIPATFINSSLTKEEIDKRLHDVIIGRVKLLYIAPERFTNNAFRKTFAGLPVQLFAVDEAHCISQWGHDFRPDYRQLYSYITVLPKRPTIAAFTATATPEVKQDIIEKLKLHDPHVYVRGFDRPNLKFTVSSKLTQNERLHEILRHVRLEVGSGIVYAPTRKKTHEIAEFLTEHNITAAAYHAGLTSHERTRVQQEFMENAFRVIVATIAFGMGVDKSDVRFVIHAGMPGSLEGYYQEAGRAGRDGETAQCVLLHSSRDVSLHHFFFNKAREEMARNNTPPDAIRRVLDVKYRQLRSMLDYVEAQECRRKKILEYFGDIDIERLQGSCNGCDNCNAFDAYRDDVKCKGVVPGDSDEMLASNLLTKGVHRNVNTFVSLPNTVTETVTLYKKKYEPSNIAKIRSLAVGTIWRHLLQWYSSGGELDLSQLITPEEERAVLGAMSRADDYQHLRSIKDQLPETIGYEKIRAVIAKIRRVKV